MVDFTPDPRIEDLRERTETFVREVAIPAEARDLSERPAPGAHHGLDPALRAELQQAARDAGLFAPTVPVELGGLGLDVRGQAVVLEAAGYSLLGPHALNCAAPDEGNMHMLHVIATPEQSERYLKPLAAGETRSYFAMTEPAPGAGSDPSMLRTTATKVDGGWSISGDKWFITGAEGAAFGVCMARTPTGATMFLVDGDNPGARIDRVVHAIDTITPGGHAEMTFDEAFVPDDAVLGAVGEGFRYAQVRLAPARLTHCMRWLGVARRAHDIALDRAAERDAFGGKLGSLGMIQERIAQSVIDIETSRLLIQKCAWVLDEGGSGKHESSIAKAYVGEAAARVIDRSLQICGSLGVSGDLPLGRLAAEVRPFRIYDGPTETHLWSIARRTLHRRSPRPEPTPA